jgi:hypothetical protein
MYFNTVVGVAKRRKFFAPVKRIQFLSNFVLLLGKVGSQTVGPLYQYQQLTQHGLKMDENSLHPTFQEILAELENLLPQHEIDIVAIQKTKNFSF